MSEIKIKEVMEEIYHKLQDGDTRLSEEQAERDCAETLEEYRGRSAV